MYAGGRPNPVWKYSHPLIDAVPASKGGRKAAFRTIERGTATSELIAVSDGFEELETTASHPDARALQVPLVVAGEPDAAYEGPAGVQAARAHHVLVREELPVQALALSRSDPAIPTVFVDALQPEPVEAGR